MRPWVLVSITAITFLTSDFAFATGASSDQLHTFYGDVTEVDLAAHTITIKSGGKRLVFHVTDETKISGGNGHVSLDRVNKGGGATVVMKLGEGNVGIAVRIHFDAIGSQSNSLKLFVARTITGEVVSGMAVNNFIAYQPPADAWSGGPTHDNGRVGMFLLVVQPDGTVANVKMIKSTGYDHLNLRAVKWLKKWRFHPNSVSEVQMPMSYFQSKW